MLYKAHRPIEVGPRTRDVSMLSGMTGRRPGFSAVTRGGLLAIGLLLGAGLSACTTVEGTNAMTDIATFEREVAIESMLGMGMMERTNTKDENIAPRGPLVMPKSASLPAPGSASTATAALPVNSDKVQIDTAGLSKEDLSRLRNARVVDNYTLDGRPLTEEETRKLTARMTAARIASGPRPLYMPPEQYFTTVKGQDTVCMAKNGELVPLSDPNCPPEVRKALQAQQ